MMQAVVIYSDEMKFKVLQTCGPCINPDNGWLAEPILPIRRIRRLHRAPETPGIGTGDWFAPICILLHILQKIMLINWLKVHFLLSIFCMVHVTKIGSVPKLYSRLHSCYTAPQCLGGQCKTLYWWSCSVCSRQRWQNIPPIFRDQSSRLQLPKSCTIRLDGSYLFCWLSSDINILIWPEATDEAACHEMLWEWPHCDRDPPWQSCLSCHCLVVQCLFCVWTHG